MGLDYLSLDRTAGTLSGGEGQRIRLATQIGSSPGGGPLHPGRALHRPPPAGQRPPARRPSSTCATSATRSSWWSTTRRRSWRRTTSSTWGPGRGSTAARWWPRGRRPRSWPNPNSLTGRYLSGELSIPVPKKRRKAGNVPDGSSGPRENNLKDIDVDIPLGVMTCVTGVSGSGKSTLVIDTLYKVLSQRLYRSREKAGAVRDIKGLELARQGDQHRPVPHRPHPPLQPRHLHRRLHRHPRPLRPAPRIAGPGLQAGALLLQRQGGALRGLLRGRHHQDRDALPAGRLRAVRGLQGGALQPGDPGGAVQGEDRSPRCST